MKSFLRKTFNWVRPFLTWKMLPFLLIAWTITNGWSYAFVVIGQRYNITWMTVLGFSWMSFLWFPLTIEKPITLFIAGFLYKTVYKETFRSTKGEILLKEIETKQYYFMTYAEWFFVDVDYTLKLTKTGKSVPEAVISYEQYLKDYPQ